MTSWSICPYCCEPLSRDPDDDHRFESEHVIPSAIGGNLEVPACAKCNRALGKVVDRRLLDDPRVKIRRATYAIQPMRGTFDVRRLAITGQLSIGGGTARWSPGDPQNTIEMLTASDVTDHGDGRFSFTCPPGNRDTWLRRVRDELQSAHPDKTVTVDEAEYRIEDETRFEHSYAIDPILWPQFAAKVSMCLGGLTFGEPWLTTDEAWKLRGLLRHGRKYRDQFPEAHKLPVMPTEIDFDDDRLQRSLYGLLAPNEHYLSVDRAQGGVVVFTIALFGAELQFRLAINSEHAPPASGQSWLLDGTGNALSMSRDLLVGWLAMRAHEHDSPLRLRRDLPHPTFIGRVRKGSMTLIAGARP